jgi:acylphosphatase
MSRRAVHLIIRGRVQGVGYRVWAREAARSLGLDGWVRNRTDGTVEMVAVGGPEALDRLAEACRSGPPGARVGSVDRSEAEDDASSGFELRRTL